jgi:lipopolysaccharide biosynthesis glycosyltransferase
MEPVVIALASDDRYFSGLYCAVASALTQLSPVRKLDVKVLDGGLSQSSRNTLSRLADRTDRNIELEFVTVDPSLFGAATLGPGRTNMSYCRILLSRLLDVERSIYLDSDVLVFRDLSQLFDHELPSGKMVAAVPDSETLTLGDDSAFLADATGLPADGKYFNAGIMLLDLMQLRKEKFTEQSLDFVAKHRGRYRFHDQSAINFLLHGRIAELPEHWNRPSWRFDTQQNNDLDCVLHYTRSAPWIVTTGGPAQVLFRQLATEAGLSVGSRSFSCWGFWRSALAPLRAIAFPVLSLCCRLLGKNDRSAAYGKVARYWLGYVRYAPRRRRLYRQRNEEICRMKFDVHASLVS